MSEAVRDALLRVDDPYAQGRELVHLTLADLLAAVSDAERYCLSLRRTVVEAIAWKAREEGHEAERAAVWLEGALPKKRGLTAPPKNIAGKMKLPRRIEPISRSISWQKAGFDPLAWTLVAWLDDQMVEVMLEAHPAQTLRDAVEDHARFGRTVRNLIASIVRHMR